MRVNNLVRLGVARTDVKTIQIVDTDFVVTLKSGRKVVVPDGAVKAMLDPDFSIAFADGEVLGSSVLQSAGPLEVNTISTTSVGSAPDLTPTDKVEAAALKAGTPVTPDGTVVATPVGLTGSGSSAGSAMAPATVAKSSWLDNIPPQVGALGALGLKGGGGSSGGGGSVSGVSVAPYTVFLNAVFGQVIAAVRYLAYDENGILLNTQSQTSDANGSFSFLVTNGYKGAILIRVLDANGTGADYQDEASNTPVSLPTSVTYRAVAVADGTNNVNVTVTPLTEVATRLALAKAGIADDGKLVKAPGTAHASTANAKVAAAFGVSDIVGVVPVPVNKAAFYESGTSAEAKSYGLALAALSGLDTVNENATGSVKGAAKTIADIVATYTSAGSKFQPSDVSQWVSQGIAPVAQTLVNDTQISQTSTSINTNVVQAAVAQVAQTLPVASGSTVPALAVLSSLGSVMGQEGLKLSVALSVAPGRDLTVADFQIRSGGATADAWVTLPASQVTGFGRVTDTNTWGFTLSPDTTAWGGKQFDIRLNPAISLNGATANTVLSVSANTLPLLMAPTGALNSASDSGVSSAYTHDNITNFNGSAGKQPQFDIVAEAGLGNTRVKLQLTVDGVVKTYSAVEITPTGSATGLYRVTVTDVLPNDQYVPVVNLYDVAGNATPTRITPVTIKTVVDAPTGMLSLATDSVRADLVTPTNNGRDYTTNFNGSVGKLPELTLTAQTGSTVSVKLKIGSTFVKAADGTTDAVFNATESTTTPGTFTVTIDRPLADGTYTPYLRVSDVQGNVNFGTGSEGAAGTAFEVRTQVSGNATVRLSASSDVAGMDATLADGTTYANLFANNGLNVSADNATSQRKPTLQVTAPSGVQVNVTVSGHTYSTTTGTPILSSGVATGQSTYSVTLADDLANGTYDSSNVTVTVVDRANNSRTLQSAEFTPLTVNYASPTTTINSLYGNDVVNLSRFDAGVQISGTASVASSAIVVNWLGKQKVVRAGTGGYWSVNYLNTDWSTLPADASASSVAVTVIDPYGNTSTHQRTVNFDLRFTPTLTLNKLNPGDATLENVVNFTAKQAGVTFAGKSEPNASVTLTWSGSTVTTQANATGDWSATFATGAVPADATSTQVRVSATDSVGNAATPLTMSVLVDTQVSKPTISVVSEDNVVNQNEKLVGVTFRGTAPGATKVRITWGATSKELTVDADGNWTTANANALLDKKFTSAEVPADGSTTVSVVALDSYGNTSAAATRAVQVQTQAPTIPVIFPTGTPDDSIVNLATASAGVVVKGKVALVNGVAPTVKVTWAGLDTPYDTFVTSRDTVYAYWGTAAIPNAKLPTAEGVFVLTATATDGAGNSNSNTQSVLIDRVRPGVPVLTTVAGKNVATLGGVNAADKANGVTVVGTTTEPNATIEILWLQNPNDIAPKSVQTQSDANGRWSATFAAADVPVGTQTQLWMQSYDAAGNPSSDTPVKQTVNVDTSIPTVTIDATNLTVNAARKNAAAGITFTGTAESGADVTLSWGNTTKTIKASTPAVGTVGTWSVNFTPAQVPPDGPQVLLRATVSDAAGNVGTPVSLGFTIDTVSSMPVINTVGNNDIVNAATKQSGVHVSGTAEPLATVVLSWNGHSHTVYADSTGFWTTRKRDVGSQAPGLDSNQVEAAPFITAEVPADTNGGQTTISAVATDVAGNTSATGTRNLVMVQTAAPSAPIIATVAGDMKLNADEKASASGLTISGIARAVSQDAQLKEVTVQLIGKDSKGEPLTVTHQLRTPPLGLGGVTLDSDGVFTTVFSKEELANFVDGTTTVSVQSTDRFDNTQNTPTTRTFEIQTLPPRPPVIQTIAGEDPTAITSANYINAAEKTAGVTVAGVIYKADGTTALVGANLTVQLGDTTLTVVSATGGAWSATFTTGQIPAEGTSTLRVRAVDDVGNTSNWTQQTVTVDTVAPGFVSAALNSDSDTGSKGDGLTNLKDANGNAIACLYDVVADAGATVRVQVQVGGSLKTYTASEPSNTAPTRYQVNLSDLKSDGTTDGTFVPTVIVTDTAGNTTQRAGASLTIKSSASAVRADLDAGADSGASNSDNITNYNSSYVNGVLTLPVVINVNTDTGGTVKLKLLKYNNATSAYDLYVTGNGTSSNDAAAIPSEYTATETNPGLYQATITHTLADGDYKALVTVTDKAGNVSVLQPTDDINNLKFTVDTQASPPSMSLAADTGNGSTGSASDALTNNPLVSIADLHAGNNVVWSWRRSTVGGSADSPVYNWGDWVSAVPGATNFNLAEGTFAYQVRQIDGAGNVSAASGASTFTYDKTPTAVPTLAENAATRLVTVTTNNPGGGTTTTNYLNASGVATPWTLKVGLPTSGVTATLNDQVQLWLGNTLLTSSYLSNTDIANQSVTFNLSGTSLGADGDKSLTARVVDVAGNASSASSAIAFRLDTTAFTAPSMTELVASGGTAIVTDGYINNSEAATGAYFNVRVNFTGTGAAVGDHLQLRLNGTPYGPQFNIDTADKLTAGVADYRVNVDDLGIDGLKSLTLRLWDDAGNQITTASTDATGALSFTLDRSAPTATVVNVTSLSNDTGLNDGISTNNDFITSAAAQDLTGTYRGTLASGEDWIEVSADGGATWVRATVQQAYQAAVGAVPEVMGTWKATGLTLRSVADQQQSIQTRTIDNAGNVTVGPSRDYTYDNTAPSAIVNGVSLSADTGVGANADPTRSDFVTSIPAQTLSGTYSGALGSDWIQYSLDGGTTWAYVASAANGSWSTGVNAVTLLSGIQTLKMRTVDLAGNTTPGTTATERSYTLDTLTPTITRVTYSGLASDKSTPKTTILGINDWVRVEVVTNEKVDVSTGIPPKFGLTMGTLTRWADYDATASAAAGAGDALRGHLVFYYQVQTNDDSASGGLSAAASPWNDGTNNYTSSVYNRAGTTMAAALAGVEGSVVVSTTVPAIAANGVSLSDSVGKVGDWLNTNDTVTAAVKFNKAVVLTNVNDSNKPTIDLVVGSAPAKKAIYSGMNAAGDTLYFSYTVQANDSDTNGIAIAANSLNLNGASLKDVAGIDAGTTYALVSDNPSYKVDATAPTMAVVITGKADTDAFRAQPTKTLVKNDVIKVLVTFTDDSGGSGLVTDVTTGLPQFALDVGGVRRLARYSATDSTPADGVLGFTYTVVDDDLDTNGGVTAYTTAPDTNPLVLNNAVIRDVAGNAVNPTPASVTSNTIAVDANPPRVNSVVITGRAAADGSVKTATLVGGDKVRVTVTLDQDATLSPGAAPTYTVKLSGNEHIATYVAGLSTARQLVFETLVGDVGDDVSSGGITAVSNALSLNGATLRDAAGNDALVTTAAIGRNSNNITVDVINPVATLLTTGDIASSSTSIQIQSSELGRAYLVRTGGQPFSVLATDITSQSAIEALPADSWVGVDIAQAHTPVTVTLSGKLEGTYTLYVVDLAGNLGAVAPQGSVMLDTTGMPVMGTQTAITLNAAVSSAQAGDSTTDNVLSNLSSGSANNTLAGTQGMEQLTAGHLGIVQEARPAQVSILFDGATNLSVWRSDQPRGAGALTEVTRSSVTLQDVVDGRVFVQYSQTTSSLRDSGESARLGFTMLENGFAERIAGQLDLRIGSTRAALWGDESAWGSATANVTAEAGGGGVDTLVGSSDSDLIFGDGSGGGAYRDSSGASGGAGGGGADIISGGSGDDIIFGDGFKGSDATSNRSGSNGGYGGGGGGWSSWNPVGARGARGGGGIGAGGGAHYNLNGWFAAFATPTTLGASTTLSTGTNTVVQGSTNGGGAGVSADGNLTVSSSYVAELDTGAQSGLGQFNNTGTVSAASSLVQLDFLDGVGGARVTTISSDAPTNNDDLFGQTMGTGDDRIFGGAGNDLIMAGNGNDDIQGGPGHDIMYGRGGGAFVTRDDDVFYWRRGDAAGGATATGVTSATLDIIRDFGGTAATLAADTSATLGVDRLDISQLLEGYVAGVSDLANWVTITNGYTLPSTEDAANPGLKEALDALGRTNSTAGTGALIRIDVDGPGAGTVYQYIFLTGVTFNTTNPGALTALEVSQPVAHLGSVGGADIASDLHLSSTGSVSVYGSVAGTAYLVKTGGTQALDVGAILRPSHITSLPDARWNAVTLDAANTSNSLSLAGLEDGQYSLFVADASGNLSAAATALVSGVAAVSTVMLDTGLPQRIVATGISLVGTAGSAAVADSQVDNVLGNFRSGTTDITLANTVSPVDGMERLTLDEMGLMQDPRPGRVSIVFSNAQNIQVFKTSSHYGAGTATEVTGSTAVTMQEILDGRVYLKYSQTSASIASSGVFAQLHYTLTEQGSTDSFTSQVEFQLGTTQAVVWGDESGNGGMGNSVSAALNSIRNGVAGASGVDALIGSAAADLIFGDGSGGGTGGGIGASGTGGAAGGGADQIFAGTGNDLVFGDGFKGTDSTGQNGFDGGYGGGGGGGALRGGSGLYAGGSGGVGAGSGGNPATTTSAGTPGGIATLGNTTMAPLLGVDSTNGWPYDGADGGGGAGVSADADTTAGTSYVASIADTTVGAGQGQFANGASTVANAISASRSAFLDGPGNANAENRMFTQTMGVGDDALYGGAGNDLIMAGNGNDLIYGGMGHDIMYGRGGGAFQTRDNDTFGWQRGDAAGGATATGVTSASLDIIRDFGGNGTNLTTNTTATLGTDAINLTQLLEGYVPGTSDLSQWVTLTQSTTLSTAAGTVAAPNAANPGLAAAINQLGTTGNNVDFGTTAGSLLRIDVDGDGPGPVYQYIFLSSGVTFNAALFTGADAATQSAAALTALKNAGVIVA